MYTVTNKATKYQSFLIRLWQESPLEPWRGAVVDVKSGETKLFADIDQLLAFLIAETTTGGMNNISQESQ